MLPEYIPFIAIPPRFPSCPCTGASGDLAKKKTFPSLSFLHCNGFFPANTRVVGYARTPMSDDEFRERLRPHLKGDDDRIDAFLQACSYVYGAYDSPEGYQALQQLMEEREAEHPRCPAGRLFYLALPPTVYPAVCAMLKANCDVSVEAAPGSWARVVVEKPFGRDVASSEELAEALGSLWPESQLYRIDHYLGKEMLQSLFVSLVGLRTFFYSWFGAVKVCMHALEYGWDAGTYFHMLLYYAHMLMGIVRMLSLKSTITTVSNFLWPHIDAFYFFAYLALTFPFSTFITGHAIRQRFISSNLVPSAHCQRPNHVQRRFWYPGTWGLL
jgi:hypothetical protein